LSSTQMEAPAPVPPSTTLPIKEKDLEALREAVSHLPIEWSKDESLLRRVVFCRETHKERVQMFEELVKWHQEYKPQEIKESEISEELQNGAFFINGKDKLGRPILVVFGARHDTDTRNLDRTIRAIIYWLMKAIAMMGPGVEQIVVIYDRENVTRKNFDLQIVKEWAAIQNYFPLRLGLALVLQPNWLFQMSFKLCQVFLSEEALRKIHLCNPKSYKSELQTIVSRDQLLTCHGGSMETAYEYALAVRKVLSPLSVSQRERQVKLEEAQVEGDTETQAKLITEQYDAWEKELKDDNSPAGKALRKRLHSFNAKNGRTDK